MTDDTVTAKLAEWEALADAATEGPWDTDGGGASVGHGDKWVAHVVDQQEPNEPVQARADAEFIAAARTAMPALLKFVRKVRARHVSSSESRGVGRVDPETGEWGAYCDGDGEWWPCPTVQALTKWIGGEE